MQLAASGRESISLDLSYTVPVKDRLKLGGTPRDYFDQSPTPSVGEATCANGACANLPQETWINQPRLTATGEPVLRTVNEHVEGHPASVLWNSLGYGAAAGLAGAVVGGVLGYLTAGQPLVGAAAGAALAGVSVGAVMGQKASQDRVALEWRPHAIVTEQMTGYRETVTPGNLNGQSGYYHRFQPIISRQIVGTYQTPHVVHYTEKEKGG
jgi:hypothetical protein